MDLLLLLQIFACFSLTGLIWLIQLVHYPSFKYVSKSNFAEFAKFHADRISFIVVPLMIVDLGTALFLVGKYGVLNALLVILIWLSTAIWSVPCHARLQKHGKDEKCIQRLVLSNWPRTILWSVRSIMWLFVLLKL